MTEHSCPFRLGELLALYAIAKVRGHDTLAAKLLDHSRQHESEVTP